MFGRATITLGIGPHFSFQSIIARCVFKTMLQAIRVDCSNSVRHHHSTAVLRPFFRDHPGEPVPEVHNFWTSLYNVQEKINRGRHTDNPAGRHSIRTKQCPPPPSSILQAGCPSCRPTNSVKALKAPSAFGLGRRR